ncbi:hypothetical protein, partial [Bradyrhizobium ottawaense]|uniref:hypothetical protein n=1 Tax=Bradyrhizobium ottawaense TaxID=931866 RepID=UPI0030C66205
QKQILIAAFRGKLLWPTASFLRRAVLRSGGVDAPRLHQYRVFGIDKGHVLGVRIQLSAS